MGSVLCCYFPSEGQVVSDKEKARRRQLAADAAAERSKDFKQGGGGEKLKAKAKALEDAEKRQKDLGGGPSTLKWTV